MANLQRFTLEETWKEWEVVLEVDLDILTPEMATEINEFWSDAKYRLNKENGDVVRAVIRMAAGRFIYALLEIGGGVVTGESDAAMWTRDALYEQEGWGDQCGIKLISADVDTDFDLEFKGE